MVFIESNNEKDFNKEKNNNNNNINIQNNFNKINYEKNNNNQLKNINKNKNDIRNNNNNNNNINEEEESEEHTIYNESNLTIKDDNLNDVSFDRMSKIAKIFTEASKEINYKERIETLNNEEKSIRQSFIQINNTDNNNFI